MKILGLLLGIVLLNVCLAVKSESEQSNLPFFFYSNLKLFKSKESPVSSIVQFIDKFVNSISMKNNEEDLKILLFNIKTEYDNYETVKFMRKIDPQLKNIKILFNDKDSGVIYTHLDYSIKDITDEMIDRLNEKNISTRTNIYDFDNDFKETHEANLRSPKNSIEVLNLNLNSIVELDNYMLNDIKIVKENDTTQFAIFIIFEQALPAIEGSSQIESLASNRMSRILLQDDNETNPNAPSDPAVVSGLIAGFTFIFILLIGTTCLAGLKTPEKFISTPYSIGKES